MRRRWGANASVVLALGAVALAARLVPVLRGAGLHGVLAYDDGVYFASAEAFVFGRVPYRDFLLLHPPGIVLILSPFAALARLLDDDSIGLALARLAFMAVGALNAVLVYRVARARLGAAAGLAGGLFYAVWPPVAFAERTTLLEPWVNLGVLTGLLLLGDPRTASPRRLALAGAALGLATAVKLWAVVPLLVLLGWVALRRARAALPYAAGAVAAGATVCLPFLLAAPGTMLRFVVLDQLGRPDTLVPWQRRLAGLVTTTGQLGRTDPGQLLWQAVVPAALVVAAVALALRGSRAARPWCALLAAQGAVLLTTPTYFAHYGAYVAPSLALVVGAASGEVLGLARRPAPSWRPVLAIAVATGICLVALGTLRTEGGPGPGREARALLSGARCVASDSPATLQASDLFVRNLRNGCEVVVDPTGVVYDLDPGQLRPGATTVARRADASWQLWMQQWFATSDAVIVRRGNRTGLSAETLALLRQTRTAVLRPRYQIYVTVQG